MSQILFEMRSSKTKKALEFFIKTKYTNGSLFYKETKKEKKYDHCFKMSDIFEMYTLNIIL